METTIHCRRIAGGGPELTLLHGGWLDGRAWEEHLPALSRAASVTAPDLRGYGGSEHPLAPWTVADWASDVVALWDELGIERAQVLGFSMGGLVALELARSQPERVKSLILVSTTACFDQETRAGYRDAAAAFDGDRHEVALKAHVDAAFTPAWRRANPELISEYEAMARETPPASVRNTMLALADADLRPALAQIDVPALVVEGSEDRVTGGHHPQRLVDGLPRADRRLLEGAGHTLHLERPREFVDLVLDFADGAAERPA